ncbi:AAA family ATPase [Salinicola avicenniae]|uniref:AAA family ATPase n=1 Tax=Salinicola avicenniae TaxID=2916836 RepID=UPI00207414DC|nr:MULTISPECIES: AAA family ATPase [unclassified Salinicola]
MKILAIRLENLASLAGRHELDFTTPPLADQGLFAITGPTGAGKSTLLDALCLALYGNTPRLRQAPARDSQIADIGSDTLTTADARTLLRRGSASGFAEVDFVGRDGRRYRARWSVRRARDRIDGSLQKIEQSLTDLESNQLLTAQKNEFKQLLPQRLGLTFDQFTRAVLLAQSEFAAFLKADDNDRSELLERLTDTQHYSAISRAAYQRVRTAKSVLEAIDARLADAVPADAETRKQLEQEASVEEKALAELQAHIATQQREQAELEREAEMANAWREAENGLQQAESACRDRDDDRRTFEQLQSLAPWRERAQRHRTLERNLANRARELSQAQETLRDREQEAHTLDTQRQAAEADRDRADADYQAAQPTLEEARRLGAALERQQQQFEQESEERRQLAARIETDQRQAEVLTEERQRIDHDLEAQRQALEHLLAESADAVPKATLETLRSDLNRHRDAAQASLGALQTLTQAWQEAERLAQESASVTRQQESEHARLHQLERDGQQAKSTLAAQETQARHVTEQVERARIARSDSVEQLRQWLRNDEPCPVCGGTDHPYLNDPHATPPTHPGEAMLEAIEAQEREQLETETRQLEAARERHHRLGAEWRACRDGLKALEQQLASLLPRRQAADRALDAYEEAAALLRAEDARTWLAARREQSQRDYDRHGERLARLDTIERQQRPREAERQRNALSLGKLEARQALSRQRLAALDDSLPTLARSRDDTEAALRACLGEHASATAWQAALEQRRQQAQQQLESLQTRWQSASQAQTQQAQQLTYLRQRQQEEQQEFERLDAGWRAWRADQPALSDARIDQLLAWNEADIRELGDTLDALARERDTARITRDERRRALLAQRQALLPDAPSDIGNPRLDDATSRHLAERLEARRQQALELEQQRHDLQERRDVAQQHLREDDRRRQAQQEGARKRESARQEVNRWERLNGLIGSADGKRFRRIAQAYNLDRLLLHANQHLKSLTPRYRLRRGGSDLGILVIDGDMADEQRSVHSLSGGETFLVSLALALGLASMASRQLAIESLFIDEGFGSLDPQSLALAMDALDGLQAQGRRVGVISHVQEMHERIPLQIRVEPSGNGASSVTTVQR